MSGARPRVLVVSNDVVGSRMAGPGIRSYHFARELASSCEVALLAPERPDVAVAGVEALAGWRGLSSKGWRQLLAGFDVVVAQSLGVGLMRRLARRGPRTVYDLYDPLAFENLPPLAGGGPSAQDRYAAGSLVQQVALATGDAFVCASERQRDLWLGALATLGRVDLDRYRADPSLRDLVDVVPFGLEPASAARREGREALAESLPGLREDDLVLVWGGGVWDWLDPLTPIRAVARLAEARDDVKLLFMGVRHPDPAVGRMQMADRAERLAAELGVLGRTVLFHDGWVPYEERRALLAGADIGISAHPDTVEARFAYRTRIVDYLGAGLPVVTTAGDVLADLVDRERLGRVVAAGDVHGWTRALGELAGDPAAREAIRARSREVRSELAWPRVVEPLRRLVALGGDGRPARGRAAAAAGRRLLLRGRISLRERGAARSLARGARRMRGGGTR